MHGEYYDPSSVNSSIINYRVGNDVISRLGDGHLGEVRQIPADDYSALSAHAMSAAQALEPLFENAISQTAYDVDYYQLQNSQKLASVIANWNNTTETDNTEAFFRLVGGVCSRRSKLFISSN